jgi:glycyl-tRNA synthetase
VGQFTEARPFNLMFRTFVGPVEESANEVYLRPETAQAMFTNFENVVTSMRRKLPFGIAQQGRSFRNEITPGNFIFRDREFEQMELEYFCKPGTDEGWHEHWLQERLAWFRRIGVREENLRVRPHDKDELSHYSKGTYDIEYHYETLGWSELEGIANRTDFDLKQHAQHSGKSLTYFDEETNEHIVPYVIEPALGVDRTFLVLLYDGYREGKCLPRPARRRRASTWRYTPRWRRSRSPCCRGHATSG